MSVESSGVEKLAVAAFTPLDALGHERHGRAFVALGDGARRATVTKMIERAREEAKRTGLYPKEVFEALMFDAADAFRRADPSLDLGSALLRVREQRIDLRLACADVIGLRA